MRATTIVSLAVRHVGVKGAKVECWSGTLADCIKSLVMYLAPISMATRFDMCLGRNEADARNGLEARNVRKNQVHPDSFGLEDLMTMMESGDAGGASPSLAQAAANAAKNLVGNQNDSGDVQEAAE